MNFSKLLRILWIFAASTALAAEPTGAMRRIEWARAAVQENGKQAQPYNNLALALVQRARETADPAYYKQAAEALQESLRIEPDNFEGRKLHVAILLGQHEFERALDEAQALNHLVPDDQTVYALVADASFELGKYKEAEAATQTLFDMRGPTLPALIRGAALREVFNDLEGALDFAQRAYRLTAQEETEERAWLLTRTAHLQLLTGRLDVAARTCNYALQLSPDYPYALSELASIEMKQARYAEAAELFKRRYKAAPEPEALYRLGQALQRAGKPTEAKAAFVEFERVARPEVDAWKNDNRLLIEYYSHQGKNPREALRIARLEIARRRDVATVEAYAEALRIMGMKLESERQLRQLAEARGLH